MANVSEGADPTHVAVLYSVVLPEGRRLIMSDLRDLAAGLGLRDPRTLVATGNLVFAAPGATVRDLETALESAFEARFGRHVDIIVRDAADYRRLVAGNPFPVESAADPTLVMTRIMRDPIGDAHVELLRRYAEPGDRIARVGGDLWATFGGRPGQSRLFAAMTPKRLGIGTARNWNTVRRLGDLLLLRE